MRTAVPSIAPALGALAAGAATIALAMTAPSADPRVHTIEAGLIDTFVNFETPHVHPLDMTPDASRLLAVNTPDNRLEILSLDTPLPEVEASVPVGLDPVAVRARSNTEAWVVNHISDTISVVDLTTLHVTRTIKTADEPADVVFAGLPQRAFVTCSQANLVQVFDPDNPDAPLAEIPIEGEDPRALAVSPDAMTVYAAIFESGNRTTILGGGINDNNTLAFPPNVVNHPLGPWSGLNPPPNDAADFSPPLNTDNPNPLRVGLIVRQHDDGRWLDDNDGDWTPLVSGDLAPLSGRPSGWTLVDHDIARIDASALTVTYATGLMNACMAIETNPVTAEVALVGLEHTNEIRFEPNVNARFVRVHAAVLQPDATSADITDLNPHLTYPSGPDFTPIPQAERDKSIGDPRAIAFSSDGVTAYVAGMGSNNVGIFDSALSRAGANDTIEVGEGPTGLALDEPRDRLYVMNKFAGSITVVDLLTETEAAQNPHHHPTPPAIKVGRKHLYDTHKNSGLGQASCASCHIDARTDRLAWDLGDPSGEMKAFNQNCPDGACSDWHPMKGPMTTQTLQDIIGKEPHHWRGDRDGIEEFNAAFIGLLGDDPNLTPSEMQEFEDFLATIHFPPNPFRNLDNTLPTDLPLPGHFTTGRFAPAGQPLPNGNAIAGLNEYRNGFLDAPFQCVTCHTLPTGMGANVDFIGLPPFEQLPAGPNGELHHALVSLDGSTNDAIKIPQTRAIHEKTGFNTTQLRNTAGFGLLHDGSVDSIERFLSEPAFAVASDQEVANLVAFMLAFSGSDLPEPSGILEPPGPQSLDAHAAIGAQSTLADLDTAPLEQLALIAQFLSLANTGDVALVAKGLVAGEQRGYTYIGADTYQADRAAETISHADLLDLATPGAEITFTIVPAGAEFRIGIDRDADMHFDRDELDACANPADPASTPLNSTCACGDADLAEPLGLLDFGDVLAFLSAFTDEQPAADLADPPGVFDFADILAFLTAFGASCP
ncbi:MAG: GC-type dockerin domain-anchored protein [Phycisphaerales bacterium JB059]